MPFDLSGKPLSSARISVPRYGIPNATVVLVDAAEFAIGARVTLSAGDVVLEGTITSGGTIDNKSSYELVGGAGGLEKEILSRSYGDSAGVMLARVAHDLLEDCGETLGTVDDRALEAHWTRIAGTASTALRELVGERWYVDLAGVTHLATRPVATSPAAGSVIVSDYDPSPGRGELAAEDDAFSRFLPGSMLASPLLPAPIVVVDAVLHVGADAVRAEVLSTVTSPLVELVLRIFASLTRWTRFHGLYAYEVLDDSTDVTGSHEHELGISTVPGGEVNLRNVSGFDELPDLIAVPKAHGMPGAWSVLAAGTVALIGFKGGRPSQPFVASYLPWQPTPIETGLDATTTINMGTPGGAVSLAKKAEVNLALQSLWTQIGGTGPLPSITGTTKLKGE